MKKIVLRTFTYIAILFLIDSLIHGFEFTDAGAVILFALLLSITELIIKPIVKFFMLPLNFFTFCFFNFILSCIYLYIFDLLIPGLQIVNGYLGPFVSSAIEVPTINVTQIGVIAIAAIIISLLNGLVGWTQD